MKHVEDALVSFWSSPDSKDEAHFVGSGFFIAPCKVLTAKHLFKREGGLWLRPERGTSAITPASVASHPELDAAIATLDVMPEGATVLRPLLDSSFRGEVKLNGYFEGKLEAPHPYTVTTFDSNFRHYLLSPKQPQGHSGSAACVDQRVWGMTIQHYIDPNTLRGCALAIHQLRPWLCEQIPDLGRMLLPPSWDEWVASGRAGLTACFDSPVFPPLLGGPEGGLPDPLSNALATTTASTLGMRCVEALIDVLKRGAERLNDGSATLGRTQRDTARERLREAMGVGARLCLNPEKLPCRALDDGSGLDAIIDFEAINAASAAISTGLNRGKCWEAGVAPSGGRSTLKDKWAHSAGFEMGEGVDRQKELARQFHRILYPASPLPVEVSKATLREIRGELRSEAKEGRARLLVLKGELPDALRQELSDWMQRHLGVSLLLLREPDDDSAPYYLCDEGELLARIHEFVKLINQPEWNPA